MRGRRLVYHYLLLGENCSGSVMCQWLVLNQFTCSVSCAIWCRLFRHTWTLPSFRLWYAAARKTHLKASKLFTAPQVFYFTLLVRTVCLRTFKRACIIVLIKYINIYFNNQQTRVYVKTGDCKYKLITLKDFFFSLLLLQVHIQDGKRNLSRSKATFPHEASFSLKIQRLGFAYLKDIFTLNVGRLQHILTAYQCVIVHDIKMQYSMQVLYVSV